MGIFFIAEDDILDVCFLRKKDTEDFLISGRLYWMRLIEESICIVCWLWSDSIRGILLFFNLRILF
jgi:hypothetical protein